MLAHVEKIENGCIIRFEKDFAYSKQEVWSYLTKDEKLKQWFPELSISKLEKGAMIQFDFQNGMYENMEILDVLDGEALEFTWEDDVVRFELITKSEGCQLTLIERVREIKEQTIKDLAGWHICLLVIESLLKGKEFENQEQEWEKYYKIYKDVIQNLK